MDQIGVRQIAKSYDGNPALQDVSFSVGRGEVLALCGENGAGKSTLINILSGAVRPDSGEVLWQGRPVALRDPHHAIALGIHTVHQELSLLPHLSIAENIFLGRMPHRRPGWRIDWRRTEAAAERLLAERGFPPMDVRRPVGEIGVALRQLVEIAKALVGDPKVLILDEPTAVLSAVETELLFANVRRFAAGGTTVVYISHRLDEVFAISDRILVLKDGRSVMSAPTREADTARLIQAMVGRPLAAIYPARQAAPGPVALEVRDLGTPGQFEDVGFSLAAGEIVGMAGLVGSGRTEVARAIFGAEPAAEGEIRVGGGPAAIRRPADAIRHGIALVTEDRKLDGLALDLSILDNGGLASMRRVSRHGILDRRAQRELVGSKARELAVRPAGLQRIVRQLSGGNQQKVVLSKWLLVDGIRVFIFDEPTRGVDVATKVEIYRIIAALAEAGAAVLLISSDLPEVLGMSDRVLVMRRGRLVATLSGPDLTAETVFAHAAGVAADRAAA